MTDLIYIIVGFLYLGIFSSTIVSFIVCWDYRRRANLSIIKVKDSYCENCEDKLNAIQLFPVLGTIIYKGKCKKCKVSYDKTSFVLETIAFTITPTIILVTDFNWTLTTIASITILTLMQMYLNNKYGDNSLDFKGNKTAETNK